MSRRSSNSFVFAILSTLFTVSSLAIPASSCAAEVPLPSTLRIGVINGKKCLEKSKLGQQEQQAFEKIKNQMEATLGKKEDELVEIDHKLNDDDYMDSLSDESASDLRHRKRKLQREGAELQNEYMKTLQQLNMRILHKITESMNRASQQVAEKGVGGGALSVVLSDEACAFYHKGLDISDLVITQMDQNFESDSKE